MSALWSIRFINSETPHNPLNSRLYAWSRRFGGEKSLPYRESNRNCSIVQLIVKTPHGTLFQLQEVMGIKHEKLVLILRLCLYFTYVMLGTHKT
jgi:hypothetical protein